MTPFSAAQPGPTRLSPFMPVAGTTPFSATKPTLPMGEPAGYTPGTGSGDWLDSVGSLAKFVGTKAASEIAGPTSGQRMQGSEPPMSGMPAQPIDREGAAKAFVSRSPMLKRATEDPAGVIKEATGRDADEIFAQMQEATGEAVPEGLDKQDRALILMQMGLGIMSGGPSIMQAIGQAGMATLGTWQQAKERRMQQALATQKSERELLGTEMEMALGREKIASQEKIAGMKAAPGARSNVGKLAQDLAEGRITQAQHDAEIARINRVGGGGQDDTALMQNAKYFGPKWNMSEGEAGRLLMLGTEGQDNPEKLRADIYVKALAAKRGDAQDAIEVTEQAMAYLTNPESIPADIEDAPAGPTKGAWAAIKDMIKESASAVGLGGGGEPVPSDPAAAVGAAGAPPAAGPTTTPPPPDRILSPAQPLPEDQGQLEKGRTYNLPDGRQALYTGTPGAEFDLVE